MGKRKERELHWIYKSNTKSKAMVRDFGSLMEWVDWEDWIEEDEAGIDRLRVGTKPIEGGHTQWMDISRNIHPNHLIDLFSGHSNTFLFHQSPFPNTHFFDKLIPPLELGTFLF